MALTPWGGGGATTLTSSGVAARVTGTRGKRHNPKGHIKSNNINNKNNDGLTGVIVLSDVTNEVQTNRSHRVEIVYRQDLQKPSSSRPDGYVAPTRHLVPGLVDHDGTGEGFRPPSEVVSKWESSRPLVYKF